jgi:hypothetical protein
VTARGAGSVKKVGRGAVSRGFFRKERAPKKFSLEIYVGDGGRWEEGLLKKFLGHVIIFYENNKIFPEIS